jgi:hypothetical protein
MVCLPQLEEDPHSKNSNSIFHPSSCSGLSLNCFKKGIERAGRARIDDFGNSTPLPFPFSRVKIARSISPPCRLLRRNYSSCIVMMMMILLTMRKRTREWKNLSHSFVIGAVFALICWTWMMKSRSLSWISRHKRKLEQENFLMEMESVVRITFNMFKIYTNLLGTITYL